MPEDPNLENETDEIKPEIEKPTEPQPPAPAVDYEKKFADSTRENQLLRDRLAAEEKARQEQTKEPTEPELRTAFPLWDSMSDTEKELARRTVRAERIGGNAAQEVQEIKAKDSWNTSVELAIASNNALQGKEQAFRQYASRPQYRGASMDLLVGSFLQTQSDAPAPKVTPRPGLEPANGGPRTPEKPKTLSGDELSALRKTDQKAYEQYIKTHDITLEE